MKKVLFFLLFASFFISCTKNLVTGRKQLDLVSETELQNLATQEYQVFLNTNNVINSSNNRDAEMVRRVGTRISAAITSFYDKKGYTAKILSRRPKHKLRTEYDEIAAGGQCPILKY